MLFPMKSLSSMFKVISTNYHFGCYLSLEFRSLTLLLDPLNDHFDINFTCMFKNGRNSYLYITGTRLNTWPNCWCIWGLSRPTWTSLLAFGTKGDMEYPVLYSIYIMPTWANSSLLLERTRSSDNRAAADYPFLHGLIIQ